MCIPGSSLPGDATYGYSYEPLCQLNVPDTCAPRVCYEAEAPARLFSVLRIHLATGDEETRGAGCYTTKSDPPVITPEDVLTALKTVAIPPAEVTVQPPGGQTLVNLKTITSSDAAPYEVDVTVLGQSVHLWLKPTTWTWDFGDGSDPVARTDPGVPWTEGVSARGIDDTYTFHQYTSAEQVDLSLTVTWSATFRVGDGPVRDVPGTVDITSPPVTLEVLEATPQLVIR